MSEGKNTTIADVAGNTAVAAGNAYVAGAILLLAGFLTSVLFLVVAAIFWTQDSGVIAFGNAIWWFICGVSGLGKSSQALAKFRKDFRAFTDGLEQARAAVSGEDN